MLSFVDLPGVDRSRETESRLGATRGSEEGAGMGSDYLVGTGCFYRALKSRERQESWWPQDIVVH